MITPDGSSEVADAKSRFVEARSVLSHDPSLAEYRLMIVLRLCDVMVSSINRMTSRQPEEIHSVAGAFRRQEPDHNEQRGV